jgi:hypothetical protein
MTAELIAKEKTLHDLRLDLSLTQERMAENYRCRTRKHLSTWKKKWFIDLNPRQLS